jgi:glycosyltransferase involved in cell wall biosynthesis
VLVVSRALGATAQALGAAPERVVHFPNGVDEDTFRDAQPAPRPASLRGRTVLLFSGSLRPWHGIPFLLSAFAQAAERRPELGLWVVGDGPLRPEVEALRERMPDRVVCEGAVPHERIPGILRAADVALAPYDADSPAYFCPLKVTEAMAAGCPILAADVPCVREVVGDPSAAVLHAPGDPDAFSEALDSMLADPDRTRTRAQRGARLALEELTWQRRAQQVRDLMARLREGLAGARSTGPS